MKLRIFICNLIACVFVSGCVNDECILADSAQFVTQVEKNNINYFFYKRTTGFQDKVTYLEMYQHRLENECLLPEEILWSSALEINDGKPMRVIIDQNRFKIEFNSEVKESYTDFSDASFVFDTVKLP